MEKLREQYEKEVVPTLMKKFNYKSIMEIFKFFLKRKYKIEQIILNYFIIK